MQSDLDHIVKISDNIYELSVGFVPNMKIPGRLFIDQQMHDSMVNDLGSFYESGCKSFLPALKQVANVAALPGVVGASIGLPDIHSGYGFAIGNIAAMDMSDRNSVVSPGGVGFDINCGVRLLRTNLVESDIREVQVDLGRALFQSIPVGVGAAGSINVRDEIDSVLENGLDWSMQKGLAWNEDREHCEANGVLRNSSARAVGQKAKARGISQIGTMGAGNHYLEVQYVSEINDYTAAKVMGIERVGQVCVMIHSGSRGLGHGVASDAIREMEELNTPVNDRQLACAQIHSEAGQKYLQAMNAAANFAFVNRAGLSHLTRNAFSKIFNQSAEDLDMHLIYDVSHNIAKVEKHIVNGREMELLVHRKGSTRAFPPGHPELPVDYQAIGQPVLVGGSMGTCSYVLTGTQRAMELSFGSTCHGAGRLLARNQAKKRLDPSEVLESLKAKGISVNVQSEKAIVEEAPDAYKDVTSVVDICEKVGISKKSFQLKPICVVKG